MSRSELVSSIVAGVLIGAIATVFGIGSLVRPAYAQTSVEHVRSEMIVSHSKWTSLRGEAATTWFSSGQEQKVATNFALVGGSQAIFSTGDFTWLADRNAIYQISHGDSTYAKWEQPETSRLLSAVPSLVGDGLEIHRHPMAILAMSPIADYIFSTGLAQRNGEYNLVEETELLGRKVWVLEYTLANESGEITFHARYWVDQQLALILRSEVYSTEASTFGQIFELTEFLSLEVNPEISNDVFLPSIDGYTEVEQ